MLVRPALPRPAARVRTPGESARPAVEEVQPAVPEPAQLRVVPIAWTHSEPQEGKVLMTFAKVTARSTSTGAHARVTCRIKLANLVEKESTARGPHAVAECSTMPRIVTTTP